MLKKPEYDLSKGEALYQNPTISIPSEEYYGKAYPDWSRRLNALVHGSENYRKSVKTLASEPSDLIRATEGLYPEYAQYENVPNSGWSDTPLVALKDQNALSIRDKIAYGLPVPGEISNPLDALKNEKASKALASTIRKQGFNSPNIQYKKKFSEMMIANLKEFADLEELENRNDDASRLAKMRLEGIFKRLDLLSDEKKLAAYSGVDLDFRKLIKENVYKNLLPDLQEKEGKAGASWWGASDKRIKDEMHKRVTAKFRYVHPIVQLSSIDRMTDPTDHDQINKMNNTYAGLSETAKAVLTSYQDQMKRIVSNEKSLQSDFIVNHFLKNTDLFGDANDQKKQGKGMRGMPGLTNLHGQFPLELQTHKPIGKSLIDATADAGGSFDFNEFAKQFTQPFNNMTQQFTQPYLGSFGANSNGKNLF